MSEKPENAILPPCKQPMDTISGLCSNSCAHDSPYTFGEKGSDPNFGKLEGRPGLEPADGSDLWFKAHPKEEPRNHSLVAVRHRARGALVTRDHRMKIHWEFNGHGTFQHPPSPILARLRRANLLRG